MSFTWIFSPGHVGVVGIERTDAFAGTAIIDNNLTSDPSTVLRSVGEYRYSKVPSSYQVAISVLPVLLGTF